MTKKLIAVHDKWYRFTEYRVLSHEKDYFTIVPAHGSELQEYDLWERHRKSKVQPDGTSPYQSLLSLTKKLDLPPISNFDKVHHFPYRDVPLGGDDLVASLGAAVEGWISDEKADMLAAWCSEWGLLGTLSHEATEITMKARPLGPDDSIPIKWLIQTSYVRQNGRWYEEDFIETVGAAPEPHMKLGVYRWDAYHHEVLPHSDWMPSWVTSCNSYEKAENHPFHKPLTPEFWRDYHEQVYEFLVWATVLYRALIDGSESCFNALLGPVGHSVEFVNGKPEPRHSCPSLLSAFALMALEDRGRGERLQLCEECGDPYVTDAYQSKYCSKQCQWRVNKRRQRLSAESRKSDGKKTRK